MKKLFFYLILLMFVFGCAKGEPSYSKQALLMGSIVKIDIRDKIAGELLEDASRAALERMKYLTGVLDYFSDTSEITKINRLTKNATLQMSEDTYKIIKYSRDVYNITNGAFDITVAPALELWGLYRKDKTASLVPKKEEIEEALKKVGQDKIILDGRTRSIGFVLDGMKIDLGGIAVGYIVDEASKVLKQHGIKNAIIDAGGDIYCMQEAKDKPWRIGIRDPDNKNKILGIMELRNGAVTTSGGYENFIVIQGETFHHIIDPKTAYPVKNAIKSVTVMAPTCMEADAMATAVFVLGEKKGLELVEGLDGFGCIIISQDGGKRKITISTNIRDKIKLI